MGHDALNQKQGRQEEKLPSTAARLQPGSETRRGETAVGQPVGRLSRPQWPPSPMSGAFVPTACLPKAEAWHSVMEDGTQGWKMGWGEGSHCLHSTP